MARRDRVSQGCLAPDPAARRSVITTRRETHVRTGGFTLLEIAIGLTIVLLLLLGYRSLVATGGDSSKSTDAWTEVDEKLSLLGRQVVEELKSASIVGEDINGNRMLDAGEDRNGNGRLDSDWRVTAESITFNRVLPDGQMTLPITYRLNGTDIERIAMKDTAGSRSRSLVVAGVTAFAVAQNGNTVILTARFQGRTRDGKTIERHRIFDVTPRN
jgi:type II secretory pathway component PulJ